MIVTAKWYAGYIQFHLDFEDKEGSYYTIRFYMSDNNLFTDERDDMNGSSKWFFFTPEENCDEDALRCLRNWFMNSTYKEVFQELGLSEGSEPKAPGYSFMKADRWHYWNDVLMIVETAAMDI